MTEFNVSPDFSVYRMVERARENVSLVQHRRTMSIISREIENATLVENAASTIFAGFQRYSRFLPQMNRYRGLAKTAKKVFVFGYPDAELPVIENIVYVPLKSDDQLTKEWFIVSYGKEYFSALATEELTRITDPDEQRVFKGIWTFDLDLVAILYEWLCNTVGWREGVITLQEHNFQLQMALMVGTIARLTKRLDQSMVERPIDAAKAEIRQLLTTRISPELAQLKTQHPPTSDPAKPADGQ
jgi:hypothetical protein